MNRRQNIGEKSVIAGTTAAFSCEGYFGGIVFENAESHMPYNSHVSCGMVLAHAAVVFPEGHVEAPMQ